jgi:hypothetical protein
MRSGQVYGFLDQQTDDSKREYALTCSYMWPTVSGKRGVSAESRASLPDFYNEARIVFQGMCDGGKISYSTFYRQGSYVIEEARIVPGGLFYFMKRYLGKEEGWEERYFIKLNDSAKLRELAHEEWDEDIKLASVNYFNKLHDLPTTCTKLLVS